MKPFSIATVVALIALLPGYSLAMASKHHERGAEHQVAVSNAGSDASGYGEGSYHSAPVSVPEPGSFALLATGFSTVGGFLAGKWYVNKKRANRAARRGPQGPVTG